ncbi:hypothetical protein AVEN_33526-1 [Araneus ventricosus]|uniref:Uncharacterized protein n=1 Tax=Araneus ventricosus TaxID=182803 RepID=A0A4Y2GM84_ARAVE|nr:hypothetical protein AVEN_33526-1 [Araneus ventricosus]
MNISNSREHLVNKDLKFPVSEKFTNDNSEIFWEIVRNKLGNKSLMPQAIKFFHDIQEDTSNIMLNVETVHYFIANSQVSVSSAVISSKSKLLFRDSVVTIAVVV